MTSHRLCIAPMLDWTDRHYRFMARQISRCVRLYTEMIPAGGLVFGKADSFLAHHTDEHPVALQLGGSDIKTLQKATQIAAQVGFDEVNLNCGCPSDRVQKGAFGACLMRRVDWVCDCLNAMQDDVDIPVTIKHRIGLDEDNDYSVVRDFVGTLSERTACRIFIVHARNAWLNGLSPKENRTIPPLHYDYVYQLKRDFPHLSIIINGGIDTNASIGAHLEQVDGAMIGRAAYHHPLIMRSWDADFYHESVQDFDFYQLIQVLTDYLRIEQQRGTPLPTITRHYVALFDGVKGARRARQVLSDTHHPLRHQPEILRTAFDCLCFNTNDADECNPVHRG